MYVIDDGRVHWEPGLNLNAVILGGQVVAIMLSFTVRTLARVFADRRSTTVRRLTRRPRARRSDLARGSP